MFFKRVFGLLLCLTLLLSACQPINPSNTAAPAPATESDGALPDLGTLQIAYVPILSFTPLFVAAEKGYFAEQGLQVELQRVRTVDEMLAPLGTGQLDISLMGATTGHAASPGFSRRGWCECHRERRQGRSHFGGE